jgi:hypothetical protein
VWQAIERWPEVDEPEVPSEALAGIVAHFADQRRSALNLGPSWRRTLLSCT